jgi:PEP-CTERM motif
MKLSTSAITAMLALTAISGRADAAVVINFREVGSDVVASASGSADLTDLTLIATTILFAPGEVTPSKGGATVGNPGETHFYKGAEGPLSFGAGGQKEASTGGGDFVGVFAVNAFAQSPIILFPKSYVSGTSLTGSSVFDNQSLKSLGLEVGAYTYTWGAGADADSLTINVGVPEPSTWAMIGLGFAALGLAGLRRRRAPVRAAN